LVIAGAFVCWPTASPKMSDVSKIKNNERIFILIISA